MTEPRFRCRPRPGHERLLDLIFIDDGLSLQRWEDWRSGTDLDLLEAGLFELLPMLYVRLSDRVPADPWMRRIRKVYKHTWTKNLRLLGQAWVATDLLQAQGIDAMILKGMSLLSFYGDPGLRPMADADILVHPDAAERALDCLLDEDWRPSPACSRRFLSKQVVPFQHGWNFRDPSGSLSIDLHWHPIHRTFGELDPNTFRENALEQELFGQRFKVPDTADTLLLALLHGAQPQLNRVVQWVADVLQILENSRNEDAPDQFRKRVHDLGFRVLARDMLGYIEWRFDYSRAREWMPEVGTLGGVRPRFLLESMEYEVSLDPSWTSRAPRESIQLLSAMWRSWSAGALGKKLAAALRPPAMRITRWLSGTVGKLQWRLYGYLRRRRFPWITPETLLPPRPDWAVPPLDTASEVSFSRSGAGHSYAISGWALPEEEYLWSADYQSRLAFSLADSALACCRIELGFFPYHIPCRDYSEIDIAVNGKRRASLCFEGSEFPTRHAVILGRSDINADRILDIVLIPLNPGRPAAYGESDDYRLLGLCLRWMAVRALPVWDGLRDIDFGAGGEGGSFLETGWWRVEADGVWSGMRDSTMRIPVRSDTPFANDLVLHFTPKLPSGRSGWLSVTLSGALTGRASEELTVPDRQEIRVPGMPGDDEAEFIDVRFHCPELFSPREIDDSEDARKLGFMLHALSLQSTRSAP